MPQDLRVEKHDRLYLELKQPMEIVSLTGWIATEDNGETEIHAHFSASTVVDDKVVFDIVGPAFQTIIGGFIGLITGIHIGEKKDDTTE
jgi:hypothetical protein